MLLRVQTYVNDINRIIDKTEVYGREMGLVGKYLKINIRNNIKNYLDMISERQAFSKEELMIIMKEFSTYLDDDILREYFPNLNSILDFQNEILNDNFL